MYFWGIKIQRGLWIFLLTKYHIDSWVYSLISRYQTWYQSMIYMYIVKTLRLNSESEQVIRFTKPCGYKELINLILLGIGAYIMLPGHEQVGKLILSSEG